MATGYVNADNGRIIRTSIASGASITIPAKQAFIIVRRNSDEASRTSVYFVFNYNNTAVVTPLHEETYSKATFSLNSSGHIVLTNAITVYEIICAIGFV